MIFYSRSFAIDSAQILIIIWIPYRTKKKPFITFYIIVVIVILNWSIGMSTFAKGRPNSSRQTNVPKHRLMQMHGKISVNKRAMRVLSKNCANWTTLVGELPPFLWSVCLWVEHSHREPLTSWPAWRKSNSQLKFPPVVSAFCRLVNDGRSGLCESFSEMC
jgi:hypothetical protein